MTGGSRESSSILKIAITSSSLGCATAGGGNGRTGGSRESSSI